MPFDDALPALRRRIEQVDAALVALIAERTRLAREAGAHKRAAGQPVRDVLQEGVVLERAAAIAGESGLDADGVRAVFAALLDLAREAQRADESGDPPAGRPGPHG